MRIGILGSGLMGAKLGTLFARSGHDVTFSYARSEQKLQRLAQRQRPDTAARATRQTTQTCYCSRCTGRASAMS